MNDNFNNFDNNQNEITMSELEMKAHKGTFSKLCFAFLAYLLFTTICSAIVAFAAQAYNPALLEDYNFSLIVSSILQYALGLPLVVMLLKKIPAAVPGKSEMSIKRFLKYAVVSMFFMYIGNYLSQMVMVYMEAFLGFVPENETSEMLSSTNMVLTVLIAGIIGPIVEEYMFRKLFIDRLTPYGDIVAILLPSFLFGLFHGNLYQFFYAFFLGIAFSYIYLRTGKIIYSTALHIFINMFCGIFPTYFMSLMDFDEFMTLMLEGTITEEYVMANLFPLALFAIYEFIILGMTFIGIFALSRNLRNITFKRGEVRFPKGTALEVVLFNAGTIALITVCIIIMALNTFYVG